MKKTYLTKTPWVKSKTMATLGESQKIEYMLAVDGKHGPTKREVLESIEEKRQFLKKSLYNLASYIEKLNDGCEWFVKTVVIIIQIAGYNLTINKINHY